MKVLIALIVLALVVYGGFCGLLYTRQDQLLYPGTSDVNPAGFTSFRIQSGAALIKVWQLHPDAGPALLYFGGNGEDLGAYLAEFDKAFPDRAIYCMNYRGYGGSTGSPSEAALITDAQATYDVIRKTHDRIAVMGRSLGTGVAVALATTRDVEKIVLVTPYDSIAGVAAEHFRWAPVRWLIKDPYDSVKRMAGVRAPVLAVVAEHDEVIGRAHSDALVAAIPNALRHSVLIPNGTHNDLGDYQHYLSIVHEFLATASVGTPP
jgi:uncharacterized protein